MARNPGIHRGYIMDNKVKRRKRKTLGILSLDETLLGPRGCHLRWMEELSLTTVMGLFGVKYGVWRKKPSGRQTV